ncbi:MAG TPA: hypothetical protein VF572_05950 [Candidatus Saccharimonadales bacterium]
MRKRIIIGIALLWLVVWLVVWLATHSVINIAVSNPDGSSDLKYTITSSDGVSDSFTSKDSQIRKIVRKGSYQVLVSQGDASQFTIRSTQAFLQKTEVPVNLETEQSRRFVGNNPAPCMAMIGGSMISGECDAEVEEILGHLPATAQSPTLTAALPTNNIRGISKGMVTTAKGMVVMLTLDIATGAEHFLQEVLPGLKAGARQVIPVSEQDIEYKIQPYKDGVIVYDNGLTEFRTFSSLTAKAEQIEFEQPGDNTLEAVQMSAMNGAVALLYTSEHSNDSSLDPATVIKENEPKKEIDADSEVIIYRDGQQKHFTFDIQLIAAASCGTDKLCALSQTGLTVYDISTDQAEKLYTISDVHELAETPAGLIAVTETGVLSLDIDVQQGHLAYSFGEYNYCGVQPVQSGYVLCLLSDKSGKKALLIDPSSGNADSIDKKLVGIEKTEGVDNVTAYNNIIYIVPDYGDEVYDAANKTYGYNPAVFRAVNQRIGEAVVESGIDRSRYTIINTGTQE